jgi:PPOX class probable F420-dependent enzyme
MSRIPIPGSARAVLDADRLAHLITTNPDGSPHVTGVWARTDGAEIVFCTMTPAKRYLRNLRRDPRLALSLATGRLGWYGTEEYLVVYGTATITEGGAAALLGRLAHMYLRPGADLDPAADWAHSSGPGGFVIHVAPERFGGSGPWISEPSSAAADTAARGDA